MKIALCDDEKIETDNLSALIDRYSFNMDYNITVDCYNSGAELVSAPHYDLYFLDYAMPEMNGVELALRLKKKFHGAVTVCYLTSYENAAIEVINNRVYADAFLRKPVEETQLRAILDKFYKESFFHRFVLRSDGVNKAVYPQNVFYIEARGRNTVFYYSDSSEEFSCSITELESEYLPENIFFKVHRSFIVNMMFVESFDRKNITMKNGDIIPLTRSKEFKDVYVKFNFSKFKI